MPIVVESTSLEDYITWIQTRLEELFILFYLIILIIKFVFFILFLFIHYVY